jgi:hypothetical protein
MRVRSVGKYWLATGNGPLRKIIAEGGTRKEAVHAFSSQFKQQQQERDNAGSRK